MKNRTTRTERRPDNGCARCVWWLQGRNDDWGRCTIHRERTWWRHAACTEYERDNQIEDTIRIAGKDE